MSKHTVDYSTKRIEKRQSSLEQKNFSLDYRVCSTNLNKKCPVI